MPDNPEMSCEQILHDIKTPLSIMYSSIREIERASRQISELQEPLEILKRNWLRMIKLVTDAGDYQKLSLGLMLPKFSNHDIVALVRSITESTRTLTARKNIRLLFEPTVREKKMAVDKDILDRILLNLLSNAIKFTDAGGEVRVRLAERDSMLLLSVSDNGVGVTKEQAHRVFEPHFFEQSERNASGTGMGLFIVKQLVSLLAGDIHMESDAGGTAVTVRLPSFVLENSPQEIRLCDDFYCDNMVQIELSDVHYA